MMLDVLKCEYMKKKMTKFSYKLNATILFNIFLLEVNFDKSIIGLHFLFIFSILAKFLEN